MAGILFGALGYGVALSVDSAFGLPHTSLFSSSMDLLELSVWAFIQILTRSSAVFGHTDIYFASLKAGAFSAFVVFVAWAAVVTLARLWKRRLSHISSERHTWINRLFQAPSLHEETTSFLMVRGITYSAMTGISTVIFVGVTFAALVVVCSFIAAVPMIGMSAGSAYIRDYVVVPEICVPLADRPARMAWLTTKDVQTPKKVAASCVAIIKDDKTLGRGRVVFSTSEAIILFDPNSGAVNRIPTKDAIVQVVDKL